MPLQPAILGAARLANFRLGYLSAALAAERRTKVTILLAGVSARVRVSAITIHDAINDSPNTCNLTIDGVETPAAEQSLRVSIGTAPPRLLFNGALQTVDTIYEGLPEQLAYPCIAIDDTAQAQRLRPFGTWTDVSATTIAEYLATFEGLSTAGIAAGLPPVSMNLDGTEGFSGAMQQLAGLSGSYWKVEDGVAYLFQTDTSDQPDDIDDTPGRFEDDPPIRMSIDVSQLRTRVFGKGHGEMMLADVDAGETVLPIADAGMFNPAGGQAISDTQRINYTGIILGGPGSSVGPGAAPSVAPVLAVADGAGLGAGVYRYWYTDVTAAGESLPSPFGSITTYVINPATGSVGIDNTVGGFAYVPGGYFNVGDTVDVVMTYSAAVSSADMSAMSSPSAPSTFTAVANGGNTNAPLLSGPMSADPRVKWVFLWWQVNGGGYKVSYWVPNVPGGSPFSVHGGVVSTTSLPTAHATKTQVDISGVALGAAAVTSRKIYRSVVNGTQPKLQQTIANNTATVGVRDATADGSLGANAPTSDTSGLAQPSGEVLAGSPTLLTASAGPFASAGGWVTVGQQTIRYTGITGNTLTGIPPTGIGAILNTVKYGEHADPAPALTGVTGVAVGLLEGAPVNIWVQRDDLIAQAEQAIIDAANGRIPADGIYEGPPIVDERRGEASLIAVCDATLVLFSRPIRTVTWPSRDPKSKSGKTVHFDVTVPRIGPFDLTIQDVTITEIDIAPGLMPKFLCTASSVRWSLDDLLRRLLAAEAA